MRSNAGMSAFARSRTSANDDFSSSKTPRFSTTATPTLGGSGPILAGPSPGVGRAVTQPPKIALVKLLESYVYRVNRLNRPSGLCTDSQADESIRSDSRMRPSFRSLVGNVPQAAGNRRACLTPPLLGAVSTPMGLITVR